MEQNKIIYSEILCVFAFSLMPACSCRLCLCQMEGFIREVEILENRTNRMFGMGLVVMGIIASYFCESSGFSYIYAVLAALSGGVLIGYRTALHILTAGIVWICRIPPIHEALKKRAVNGGKGYRIGEDGIYDLGTGAMYPYDRLRTVIETKEELSVGSVFTFEKNIDPDQFARLKKYVPDKYRYYEFLEKEEKDGRGKWARCCLVCSCRPISAPSMV